VDRTTIIDISLDFRERSAIHSPCERPLGSNLTNTGSCRPFSISGRLVISRRPLLVKRNDLRGFVDASGNEVISPAYEFCYGFSSGVAVVKDKGTYSWWFSTV